MTAPDPKWVEAGAKALADEGGLPGCSIHSWRCEYPDLYGPCDCVPETVVEILAAVEPLIRREVLADLRAKADECSTVGEVLTLIEEVERG